MQDTVERTFVGDFYCDEYRGLFVIRGENVVLLGEVDNDKDFMVTSSFRELPPAEVHRMAKEELERKKARDRLKNKVLHNQGFSVDFAESHDHY
ncbi:SM-like, degradation of cytoplasmic mRNAs and positively regulates transcription initiation [Phlyctochytrium bullatum]|nr:SM-like, degradation of cytoplasmic mRNAs and positively regulates transcription initiation [Phlyctochytrium bullatum]